MREQCSMPRWWSRNTDIAQAYTPRKKEKKRKEKKRKEKKRKEKKRKEKKRKEKMTPKGVNSLRSQVLHWAAQVA